MKTLKRQSKPASLPEPDLGRADHEVIRVGGVLIPILGTVGGSPAESRQTAENIDRFIRSRASKSPDAQ